MASETHKKKQISEIETTKSKGLNSFLWLITALIITAIAVGNIYFADSFSTPIRVVAVVVSLLIALGVASLTNQGAKARAFFKESKIELRRITWPTRPEATQTTMIVMAVTVVVSLILWGFDSIIVSVIRFLTDLRF